MRALLPVAALGLATALAGCAATADEKSTSDTKPASSPEVSAAGNPLCYARILGANRLRAGDNIQVTMAVRNTGRWCFSGFGWQSQVIVATLREQPAHGTVRLIPNGGGFIYGYRPEEHYSGTDAFSIIVPSGFGESSNLRVSVTVSG